MKYSIPGLGDRLRRARHDHNAGLGFDHLPAAGDASAPVGGQEDFLPASEVMDLAFEITKTSADVYEMIAGVAECMQRSSNQNESMGSSECQRQPAALLKIVEAIEKTETRLRSLDSQTTNERPEILERFLHDCWTALVAFRGVCGLLSELIGLDGSEKPSATGSETLGQIMEQLQTCSVNVSSLPHFLARAALNLQRRVDKLVEQTTGDS